jgi:hypothetical protein
MKAGDVIEALAIAEYGNPETWPIMPEDGRNIFRQDAREVRNRLSAAGFVVLPKEELEAALKPFGKVAIAYDYWSPEVMPDFQYPVPGTRIDSALTDEPNAIGALHESDLRRAAALLAAITEEGRG